MPGSGAGIIKPTLVFQSLHKRRVVHAIFTSFFKERKTNSENWNKHLEQILHAHGHFSLSSSTAGRLNANDHMAPAEAHTPPGVFPHILNKGGISGKAKDQQQMLLTATAEEQRAARFA